MQDNSVITMSIIHVQMCFYVYMRKFILKQTVFISGRHIPVVVSRVTIK